MMFLAGILLGVLIGVVLMLVGVVKIFGISREDE